MQSGARMIAAAAVLLLPACHEDGLGEHGCPLAYTSGWGSYGLSVEHQEPTRCPMFIPESGVLVRTGATVVDGSTRDFTENRLLVLNANGSPVRQKVRVFGYDPQNRWIAAPYLDYPAGTAALGPDEAYFDLTFRSGAPGPTAQMSISYTDAVNASISGPSIVQPSGTYTWSASISSGLAPFTYRWYRDWELVGTSFLIPGPREGTRPCSGST